MDYDGHYQHSKGRRRIVWRAVCWMALRYLGICSPFLVSVETFPLFQPVLIAIITPVRVAVACKRERRRETDKGAALCAAHNCTERFDPSLLRSNRDCPTSYARCFDAVMLLCSGADPERAPFSLATFFILAPEPGLPCPGLAPIHRRQHQGSRRWMSK
ncbi:hypothetical protein VTK73DRAFT_1066 [Phialemonium thermophilum]|uniref:Uncharacterized protein n=1 Tax=Phialemonium thermophilum TaxID=223376 RepID=A0ABR3VTX5_9PEZI